MRDRGMGCIRGIGLISCAYRTESHGPDCQFFGLPLYGARRMVC